MVVIRALLKGIVWVLLGLIALPILVSIVVRLVRRFYQFPIPAFIVPFIDNPFRRRIQPPEKIVEWMDVKQGMSLLEVGPGPGTFTFAAAMEVGDTGRVYTIDIQETVITSLYAKIEQQGFRNISAEQASAHALPYPDHHFDRVYMVTVLGEIPDKQRALVEFKRVLKDDGYLAVGEIILDPDYPRRGTVTAWCREAGFELAETYGNIMHYLLLFSKA